MLSKYDGNNSEDVFIKHKLHDCMFQTGQSMTISCRGNNYGFRNKSVKQDITVTI